MELNILTNNENKLLNRKEIKFECLYQGEPTPTILSVKSKLVATLDANKELLVVDNLQPLYGEGKATCYAKIYDSIEDLNEIEVQHVIEKNTEPEVEEAAEEE